MITTLNNIKSHIPVSEVQKLLVALGKDTPDDEDLEMSFVLSVIGIRYSVRGLKSFPFSGIGRLMVRLTTDILPLYEDVEGNDSEAPANAIEAMRRRALGEISAQQLDVFADLVHPVTRAATEQSSLVVWAIYHAAKKDLRSAIDAITAALTSEGVRQDDKPNQSSERAWQEITDRLNDRLEES